MKDKLKFMFYIFLYKLIIEIVYIFSISPLYSYSGLTYNPNLYNLIFSNLMLLSILCFINILKKTPTLYLYLFLLTFIYIPFSSYYWMNNMDSVYFIYVSISMLIILFITKIPSIDFKPMQSKSEDIIKLLFIFYLLSSFYLIIKRGGIDYRAFNFDTIYYLREENNISGIMGYLLNWNTKAIAPFLIALYIYEKKYVKVAILLSIQIFYYLSFGNKAYLFSIFALLSIAFLMNFKNFIIKFTFLFSLTNLLSMFLNMYFSVDFLQRAIPYRMLYIPSQIQYQYFDFFYIHPKLHFSENFIGSIFGISNKYGIEIPILISRIFSGRIDNMAYSNTGIFSDAYSNGGFLAMIVISAIFGFLLVIVDSCSKAVPLKITIPAYSYIMFVMNDTSLFTTFLTGGFGLMIFLIYILNSYYQEDKANLQEVTV
ncbi:hypothetical protein DVY48_08470 [Enterococcus faecium]|nr:hypothetical protein DVW86_08535 [Enterococcus faecium]TKO82934.1 hypothetical protein DVY48_08470 [Enterococcus faecium]